MEAGQGGRYRSLSWVRHAHRVLNGNIHYYGDLNNEIQREYYSFLNILLGHLYVFAIYIANKTYARFLFHIQVFQEF